MRPRQFVLLAAGWMVALVGACQCLYAADGAFATLLDGYLRLLARAAGAVVGMFDGRAVTVDRVIRGRFALRIDPACASLELQAIAAAAVLAFPASRGQKLTGLAASILSLTVANELRIAALYFVGVHLPSQFDLVHEALFPALLLLLTAATFFGWTRRVEKAPQFGSEPRTQAASSLAR